MPNFPINEHWRWRTIENSIPCETMASSLFAHLRTFMGTFSGFDSGLYVAIHHDQIEDYRSAVRLTTLTLRITIRDGINAMDGEWVATPTTDRELILLGLNPNLQSSDLGS